MKAKIEAASSLLPSREKVAPRVARSARARINSGRMRGRAEGPVRPLIRRSSTATFSREGRRILLAAALTLAATPAFAHPGHDHVATFAAGVAHPLGGLDHLLAMVSVGLWAALRGGKAVWAWPLAFVGAMLAGGALGMAGIVLPLVEPAILASVIVLGVLTAAAIRAPIAAGASLIALFGLAHGYAHGAEAPAGAAVAYAAGFAIATAGLHLAGLGAGLGLMKLDRPALLHALGAGAAFGGVALALT